MKDPKLSGIVKDGYVLLNDWMGITLSEEAVKALAAERAKTGDSVVAVRIADAIALATKVPTDQPTHTCPTCGRDYVEGSLP